MLQALPVSELMLDVNEQVTEVNHVALHVEAKNMRASTSLPEFATYKSTSSCLKFFFEVSGTLKPRKHVYRMHKLLAEMITNLEILPSLVVPAPIGG